jgi:glutamate racemase
LPELSDERPIGIFDSGVGGLTVMKEVMRYLPGENIIYFGDTARIPYGVRSAETVERYSFENASFLVSKGIKALVVACNTSSAISLDLLRREFPIPVIGVVEPGARAAVAKAGSKKVAVIGTETTINSRAYERAIKAIDQSVEVTGFACPLFVPLIEEGWLDGEIVNLTARKYLSPISPDRTGVIVLGCTHYPMISNVIAEITGMPLIDSAVETAREVRSILADKGLLRHEGNTPEMQFYVTDFPEKFVITGEKFLKHPIERISKVRLAG